MKTFSNTTKEKKYWLQKFNMNVNKKPVNLTFGL